VGVALLGRVDTWGVTVSTKNLSKVMLNFEVHLMVVFCLFTRVECFFPPAFGCKEFLICRKLLSPSHASSRRRLLFCIDSDTLDSVFTFCEHLWFPLSLNGNLSPSEGYRV
jgi:hypothetical protein